MGIMDKPTQRAEGESALLRSALELHGNPYPDGVPDAHLLRVDLDCLGFCVVKDGKRIPPEDFMVWAPSRHRTSDEGSFRWSEI
jgi:hypothetical protein